MYTVKYAYCVFLLTSWATYVNGDYDCLCNYAVETIVYPVEDTSSKELGYLYEFDCKPLVNGRDESGQFFAVQFEHQVAYVEKSEDTTSQICAGEIPTADILTTTTIPTERTTNTQTISVDITTRQTSAAASAFMPTDATTVPSKSTSESLILSSLTPTQSATTYSTQSSTYAITTEMPSSTETATTYKTTTTLPTTTTAARVTTTSFQYWQTAANVTGTVYEYIGYGYNLLNGNPTSHPDPGYNMSGRIFQLSGNDSVIRELSHQRFENCAGALSTLVLLGSKSYQHELELFAEPSASHDINLRNEAFTFSPEFVTSRPSFDNVNNVNIDRISTCKFETIRYMTENAEQFNYTVSRDFAKAVCSLPTDTSPADITKYLQFLDTWGTSIVTSVDIGTRTIHRRQTTPQDIFVQMQHMDPTRIQHTGEIHGYKSSVTINTTNIESSPALNTGSGMEHTYMTGSTNQPDVIGIKLNPVTDALNWTFWKSIAQELVAEEICPDSILSETTFSMYANNMASALKQYSGFKNQVSGYNVLKDHSIQVPITWPVGTYGFMESAYGCPDDGQITWSKGMRHQDTEDFRSHNTFSPGLRNYMKGTFGSNNIDSYYCIKGRHNISPYDQQWPRGAYCLLKKGTCPSGFRSGYIYWDDDDFPNHNSKSGTLPDGTFDKNTKIYYCCRSDGSTQTPIYLPAERPFILVRYGNTCQTVHGMNVRALFVQWDDEDLNNKDSAGGMHPKDDGGSKNHRLHFCYYESATHAPVLIG